MLPGVRRAAGLVCIALVTGCTLGLGGLGAPTGDGETGENDAANAFDANPGDDASRPVKPGPRPDSGPAPVPRDASTPDAAKVDPTPPAACANAAGPCFAVPSGWALVAFAPAQTTPCPVGYTSAPSQDVLGGPNADAACGCGACSVTQPPTCGAGAVNVTYDQDFSGSCDMVAMPSPLGNAPAGSCGTDIYQGSYASYDVRYQAPAPSGGACTSAGVPKGGAVTYGSHDRVCLPDDPQASCDGGICRPSVSGTYAACIAAPGDVACPPGPLQVQHEVGTSASVDCADCECTVTGTCSGTLTLYTDTACKKGPYAISTNVCVSVSSMATYRAYVYTGAAPKAVSCQASPASAAQNVALADPQTICCAQ